MSVSDLWFRKVDGKRVPTALNGRGQRWQVRWRDVNDVPRKKNFANKDAAIEHQANLRITPEVRLSRLTVGAQYEAWIRTKRGLSTGHINNLESKWRIHVQAVWATQRLQDVRHSEVAGWVGELSAEASKSVSRQSLQVLSGVFKLAVRDGLVTADPTAGVTVPTPVRRTGRFLTASQVHDLAEACGRDAVVVRVLAFTGIRWGEMAGLRVRDFDAVRGRLWISEPMSEIGGHLQRKAMPKSKRGRDVPVPPALRTELAGLAIGREPDAPLLAAARGGIRRHSRFHKRWTPACAQVGLPGLHIHDLRHTAASLAIASGADVKAVQRMLGHTSAAMTLDLYGHLWDAGLDEVAARMGGYEQPPKP